MFTDESLLVYVFFFFLLSGPRGQLRAVDEAVGALPTLTHCAMYCIVSCTDYDPRGRAFEGYIYMSICPMVSLDSSIRIGDNTLGSVRPLYARGMSMSLRMSLFFNPKKNSFPRREESNHVCNIRNSC